MHTGKKSKQEYETRVMRQRVMK